MSTTVLFQLAKAKLLSLNENVESLAVLEAQIAPHTADSSVLQHSLIRQKYDDLTQSLTSDLQHIESDIQVWNRFDDRTSSSVDRLLAVEHEVAAIGLPDDAAGKHLISQQLKVSITRCLKLILSL